MFLRRDRANVHDENAVECFTLRGDSLGFIPRALNTVLLSASRDGVFGRVHSVGANDKGLYGLSIAVRRDGAGVLLQNAPRGARRVGAETILERLDTEQRARIVERIVGTEGGGAGCSMCMGCLEARADTIYTQMAYNISEKRAIATGMAPVCRRCASAMRIVVRSGGELSSSSSSSAMTGNTNTNTNTKTTMTTKKNNDADVEHLRRVNSLKWDEVDQYVRFVRAERHANKANESAEEWTLDLNALSVLLGGEAPRLARDITNAEKVDESTYRDGVPL